MTSDRTQLVRKLNDSFRTRILAHGFTTTGAVPGAYVMSSGIAELEPRDQLSLLQEVASFSTFDNANDPYGEHDFGKISWPGIGDAFWKIDIYADATCVYASEHPHDAKRSYRMLTLMLACEY